MDFGISKRVKASSVRGKLKQKASIKLNADATITEHDPQESYKYLRINEVYGIRKAMNGKYERKIIEEHDSN